MNWKRSQKCRDCMVDIQSEPWGGSHLIAFVWSTKLTPPKAERIVFHEITKTAILNAIRNPRDINIDLVKCTAGAQGARQNSGFKLVLCLWKLKPDSFCRVRCRWLPYDWLWNMNVRYKISEAEASYRIVGTFLVPDAVGNWLKWKRN